MKAIIYPAVFHKNENNGYWVEFPDLPGCLTEADSLEEAFLMASDALFVYTKDSPQGLPKASDIASLQRQNEDFVSYVKAEPYESENAIVYRIAEEVENGLQEKHFNKNQVAQILGVDRSYLTHIINGNKTPSPDMAKRIGLLLGFDWHVFYAGTV
ncbi:type II toxin-antitoxin system HicB family antitoxin [Pumilibacter muris]|uniref:type II toxin-antitoxin system HicB family antitoxin n=1 Tax=Pumilibacter muris TaxID=2941510 RepID=UPI002040DF2F|nr:type II toxin-antitoxin system HicB family antitoxin [Pumilibacter muris]